LRGILEKFNEVILDPGSIAIKTPNDLDKSLNGKLIVR
jgi:hypothetical protein